MLSHRTRCFPLFASAIIFSLLTCFATADIVVVSTNFDNSEASFRDREQQVTGTASGLDSTNIDILVVMVAVQGAETMGIDWSDGILTQEFNLVASANQGSTSAYMFVLQNPITTTNGFLTVEFDNFGDPADWSATSMALQNTDGSAFTIQTASGMANSDSVTYDYGTPFGKRHQCDDR